MWMRTPETTDASTAWRARMLHRGVPRDLRVRLKKPLEKRLVEGHPWLYRDALEPLRAEPGAIVTILSRGGRFVARGLTEAGPIGVRVFTTRDEALDGRLLRRRIDAAAALRDLVVPAETTAYRLVHGEGDRLPGVVVDVYGTVGVLRLDGAAAAAWTDAIVEALRPTLDARGVTSLLRRTVEKKRARVDALYGPTVPDELAVLECGATLLVDPWRGQKTGLFLDHRASRAKVRTLATGRRVLNLYAYTGGFSVAAGLGGATEVTSVDIAAPAIRMAEATWTANALDEAIHHAVAEDVPRFLADAPRDATFDLVVADPPSFAPNARSVPAALESYRKLHTSCVSRLAPGALYLAASCSSHVSAEVFDESIREGARAARIPLQILERWGPPADHPRLLAFPEGDYLTCVLARRVD